MKLIKFFIILIFSVFMFGCSANLKNYYVEINNYSIQKNYKKIDSYIESNKKKVYGTKSVLLYYLDKAYFLHLAGEYEESNKYFTLAKRFYDDNYTKSITNNISSLAINDKVLPYYGENFEISMLYIFKALNYLMLNDLEGASVEARASLHYLKTLGNNYASKKIYKNDAFVQYLTGLIFEMSGEYNDAFISYRGALDLYDSKYFKFSPPQELFNSVVDMAKKIGYSDIIPEINGKYPTLAKNYKENKSDELIILHYNGLVPYRISNTLQVAFWDAWANVNLYRADSQEDANVETAFKTVNAIASDDQITIAFPSYVKSVYNIDSSEVNLNNKSYLTNDVTNLGSIVLQNFDDRKAEIYAKTLARAAIKFTLVRAANQQIEKNVGNSLVSSVLQAGLKTASSLTEDADKRSWRVLPDKVKMARIPFDRDQNYNLEIDYKTKNNFVKKDLVSISLSPEEKDKYKYVKNLKKIVIVSMTE